MVTKAELQKRLDNTLEEKIELQQKLIDAQHQNIQLRQRIDKLTPAVPNDDVHWNKVSGGMTAEEALMSENVVILKQFQEWVFQFGEKYVKPYVHQKAYAEMIAHMMRGLPQKLAREEIKTEFGDVLPEGKTVQFPAKTEEAKSENSPNTIEEKKPQQKRLLPD